MALLVHRWRKCYKCRQMGEKAEVKEQCHHTLFFAACRNKGDCIFCGSLSCFSNPVDSRKTLPTFGLRAGSRGFTPVPHHGLRVPLFNICFRFCLRQSPHWGHTPSKCPVRSNQPLTHFVQAVQEHGEVFTFLPDDTHKRILHLIIRTLFRKPTIGFHGAGFAIRCIPIQAL